MRIAAPMLALWVVACNGSRRPAPEPESTDEPLVAAASPAPPAPERLAVDTPRTTHAGHAFVAPAGWSLSVRGDATILEAPEGGSYVVLVDVAAEDAEAAVAAAWAAYRPSFRLPIKLATVAPDEDGWTDRRRFTYQVPPNERREVMAEARRAGERWVVVLRDLAWAVAQRRYGQIELVVSRLLPRGHERESFAGRTAHSLDAARISELTAFVEQARRLTGIPGLVLGLVDHGEIVFTGGFGVRALGKPGEMGVDTKIMIASNTKALTSLMLAKLVDSGRIGWETPATDILPTFRLGDPETTREVRVRHLLCACTGMPRQDMEWLFEFEHLTPADVMAVLAAAQPTSEFGELFQYSNAMAAAAGFLGGHVVEPELELGAAYDRAMQTLVFTPLGMSATTFDLAEGRRGDFAEPHAYDLDGRLGPATATLNDAPVPVRPAGGAFSNARDMLEYVRMELAEGTLPDGEVYIGKDALLARQATQIAVTPDISYGMGIAVDTTHGVPLVGAGGALYGYHSDMVWLPEQRVGAVLLTNGEPGWLVLVAFRRKLLEVLFDGRPEAADQLAAAVRSFTDERAADRAQLTVPADPARVAELAPRYRSPALGEIVVERSSGRTIFDFGGFSTEVGSRENSDGTTSYLVTDAGLASFELVTGPGRTLVIRDAQHEYVFEPVPGSP